MIIESNGFGGHSFCKQAERTGLRNHLEERKGYSVYSYYKSTSLVLLSLLGYFKVPFFSCKAKCGNTHL